MKKIYFTKEAIADAIRVAFKEPGEFINVKPENEREIRPLRAIKYAGDATVEVLCDCMQVKLINLRELPSKNGEKLSIQGVPAELVNVIYEMINE